MVAVSPGAQRHSSGLPVSAIAFLLAVGTLGEAVRRHPELDGLDIAGERHLFSAFVDDSAAFLRASRMAVALKKLLDGFGELPGLYTQSKKCVVITAARLRDPSTTLASFPVLPEGGRARYLGILMGVGDLVDANWLARISSLQASLGVAACVTNGVPSRIAIVRAVVIPAILFTAAHVAPRALPNLPGGEHIHSDILAPSDESQRPATDDHDSASHVQRHRGGTEPVQWSQTAAFPHPRWAEHASWHPENTWPRRQTTTTAATIQLFRA